MVLMKTIVQINSTNYASTGNIMLNIAAEARKEGYKVYTSCKKSRESLKHHNPDNIYIGFWFERVISERLAYFTGLRDHFNFFGTIQFINKLKQIKPDLIHIHTLHDTFINSRMLFNYIKQNNIPVIWTFHDCCSFTGQCPYFDIAKCDKWIDGCHNCPQLNITPKSLLDTTNNIWHKKKKWFTDNTNVTIITPSIWLSRLVHKSFFKNSTVRVINNGINLDIFKPTDSTLKEKYNLIDKYIVLGVSNRWSYRKGVDEFIKLAKMLPENYQIVLVGTNDEIDKDLPSNIVSIHRTYNQEELVKLYSIADVFVNPTREENFPTVNIEALACGAPVITYETGGSPEIIDKTCGLSIKQDDINSLKDTIIKVCETKPFKKQACVKHTQKYSMNERFKEYVDLYKEIVKPSI